MSILIAILLALGLLSPVKSENKLEMNRYLQTNRLQTKQGYIYGVEIFIGDSSRAKSSIDYFNTNFGAYESAIGDVNSLNWGVECKDTPQEYYTTCELVSDEIHDNFFYWMLYKYKDASFHMRFNADDVLDIIKKDKMPVQLVVGGQKWPIDTYGMLGLAPRSAFADYVRQMYNQNLSLMFGYSTYEVDSSSKLLFKSHVVQNPVYEDKNVFASVKLADFASSWNFVADLENPEASQNLKAAQVCLTSVSDDVILVPDSDLFCENILKIACAGKDPKECSEADIDFTKVSNLKLTLGDKVFDFKADEYLYFNSKSKAACRIGDLSDIGSLQVCPGDTNIGLGRLFYQKYIPVFTYNNDKTSTLSFVSHYNFIDRKGHTGLIIAVSIVTVIVGVFLCVLSIKKKRSDEEYYVTSE